VQTIQPVVEALNAKGAEGRDLDVRVENGLGYVIDCPYSPFFLAAWE
jgi:hypothetical protein